MSALTPAHVRTSIGEVSVIFALDGWLVLEGKGRSTQLRCHRSKELAAGLVSLGLPEDEAGDVAKALWHHRPADASMASDSQSVALSIGNQWVVAAVVVLLIAVFVYVFAYSLPHDLTSR